jgi:hypothetical protein
MVQQKSGAIKTLPMAREGRDEGQRGWPGESGRHLPKCPCHVDGTCEPSVCLLKEFHCMRCKQWRPFCFGHSASNECIDCSNAIEKKILDYVRNSKRGYRHESRILYMLAGDHDGGTRNEPTLTHARIEDILFEMILDKKLEWVDKPANYTKVSDGEEDLKYRIPTKEPTTNVEEVLGVSLPRK